MVALNAEKIRIENIFKDVLTRPGNGQAVASEFAMIGMKQATEDLVSKKIDEFVKEKIYQTHEKRDGRIALAMKTNITEGVSDLINTSKRGPLVTWKQVTQWIGTPASYRGVMSGKMFQFYCEVALIYHFGLEITEYKIELPFLYGAMRGFVDFQIEVPGGFVQIEFKTSIGMSWLGELHRHEGKPFFLVCLGHDLRYREVDQMLANNCQPVYFTPRIPSSRYAVPPTLMHPDAMSIQDFVASVKSKRAEKKTQTA